MKTRTFWTLGIGRARAGAGIRSPAGKNAVCLGDNKKTLGKWKVEAMAQTPFWPYSCGDNCSFLPKLNPASSRFGQEGEPVLVNERPISLPPATMIGAGMMPCDWAGPVRVVWGLPRWSLLSTAVSKMIDDSCQCLYLSPRAERKAERWRQREMHARIHSFVHPFTL